MRHIGYDIKTKVSRKYYNEEDSSHPIIKGNMDVEITTAAFELEDDVKHVILGTCDGDFIPVVRSLKKKKNKKVSIMGVGDKHSVGMSSSLIREADNYYDLLTMVDHIAYHGRHHDSSGHRT